MSTIYIPKGSIDYENNELLNCNLNTLKDFFPIKGFPLPKDTKILTISWYFLPDNYNSIKEQYKIYKSPADKYNNNELYYDFILEDLDLGRQQKGEELPPVRYIYRSKINDYIYKTDSNDINLNDINNIIERLYIYNLMAEKNLSHARDELRRMRISITAMWKRLKREDDKIYKSYYREKINTLVKYNKFILDTYQYYMEDKTLVAKEIYKHLVNLLIRYHKDRDILIPDKLSNMIKGDEIL